MAARWVYVLFDRAEIYSGSRYTPPSMISGELAGLYQTMPAYFRTFNASKYPRGMYAVLIKIIPLIVADE